MNRRLLAAVVVAIALAMAATAYAWNTQTKHYDTDFDGITAGGSAYTTAWDVGRTGGYFTYLFEVVDGGSATATLSYEVSQDGTDFAAPAGATIFSGVSQSDGLQAKQFNPDFTKWIRFKCVASAANDLTDCTLKVLYQEK